MRRALTEALLTDEEMALGPRHWEQQFEDTFEFGDLDGDDNGTAIQITLLGVG